MIFTFSTLYVFFVVLFHVVASFAIQIQTFILRFSMAIAVAAIQRPQSTCDIQRIESVSNIAGY